MRPIWSRFGLRKPKVEIDEAAEECRRAFDIVCSFIGTRDLVQEHVAYRIWPLVVNWEMSKETISNPNEGGLVRLKYTFRFGDQFIEPDDDWLKCIEATSDELLGPYSKAEDNALSAAFRSRKKKRLNRVFDAVGFMYPDYRYPPACPRKTAETPKTQSETRLSEAEATKSQAETEARPSEPAKEKSLEIGEKETEKEATEQILPEKTFSEALDYFVRHASGKRLSEEEKREAQYYARKLKYPKGALIFNGNREEDFLYCLPDSKEISVCQEISRSFGFPTLEDGLSVLSKDELADSLAYNSLKV
jgi:hypothetical protein